jgi:hypothetical protein
MTILLIFGLAVFCGHSTKFRSITAFPIILAPAPYGFGTAGMNIPLTVCCQAQQKFGKSHK